MSGAMLQPGLCSVTVRALAATDVLRVAAQAGLAAIEWGADVHLPPGDDRAAGDLARRCSEAGIRCPSYGSYVYAGRTPASEVAAVMTTAAALGAATVRIWAPPEATPGDVARVAEAAHEAGTTVSLEFHPGTLTETARGTVALLDEIGRDDVFTYWQPLPGAGAADTCTQYRAIAARCSHLHVFHWSPAERLPLAAGESLWTDLFAIANSETSWRGDRFAYLEFVRGDDVGQLLEDAAVLKRWLRREQSPTGGAQPGRASDDQSVGP